MTKGQKFGNGVRELRNTHKPGRNPGTSTNVMIGMLNASQKRTNRAPLTEALMSKQPEIDQKVNKTIIIITINYLSRIVWYNEPRVYDKPLIDKS